MNMKKTMRCCKSLLYAAGLCIFLAGLCAHGTGEQPLRIGVMPTFNASGEPFAPIFSQHLTLKLFRDLQSDAVNSVLLNPGGFYNPDDDDFLLDYGKRSGVDSLLITRLLKTIVPEKGNSTITVQTEVLDLKSGTRSGPWKSAVEINKRDTSLDYHALHMDWRGNVYLGPSRLFEKQPLGKAMATVADQVRSQVLQALKAGMVTVSMKADKPGGSCDVRLKVLYTSKHAASKSYTIFVDNENESLGVNDGALLLSNKSGPMLLQWMLNDAPYKLPKQELYQAATEVDCSKPERQLNIKIGAMGEALLDWQMK
jgi:hypothetical protein